MKKKCFRAMCLVLVITMIFSMNIAWATEEIAEYIECYEFDAEMVFDIEIRQHLLTRENENIRLEQGRRNWNKFVEAVERDGSQGLRTMIENIQ